MPAADGSSHYVTDASGARITEGVRMVRRLQKADVGIDERLRDSRLRLVSGGAAIRASAVADQSSSASVLRRPAPSAFDEPAGPAAAMGTSALFDDDDDDDDDDVNGNQHSGGDSDTEGGDGSMDSFNDDGGASMANDDDSSDDDEEDEDDDSDDDSSDDDDDGSSDSGSSGSGDGESHGSRDTAGSGAESGEDDDDDDDDDDDSEPAFDFSRVLKGGQDGSDEEGSGGSDDDDDADSSASSGSGSSASSAEGPKEPRVTATKRTLAKLVYSVPATAVLGSAPKSSRVIASSFGGRAGADGDSDAESGGSDSESSVIGGVLRLRSRADPSIADGSTAAQLSRSRALKGCVLDFESPFWGF
jgi:hypothetical protein